MRSRSGGVDVMSRPRSHVVLVPILWLDLLMGIQSVSQLRAMDEGGRRAELTVSNSRTSACTSPSARNLKVTLFFATSAFFLLTPTSTFSSLTGLAPGAAGGAADGGAD